MNIEESVDAMMMEPEVVDLSYKFYNDSVELFFNVADHHYYRINQFGDKVTVSGVTSAVHILDKSAALTQWAANMAVDHIREQLLYINDPILNPEGVRLCDDTLISWLNDAKYAHRNYKDKAADTGHIAHDWIEQYIKIKIATNNVTDSPALTKLLSEMPEDERAKSGCIAALDWMTKHKVRWMFTEHKIYSQQHNYAGTLDGLALVTACGDANCCGHNEYVKGLGLMLVPATFVDTLVIIDWKTSNRLYKEYEYQTAAYLKALVEEIGSQFADGLEHRIIIRLGKEDGEFEAKLLMPESLNYDFNTFLDCLKLYNNVEYGKEHDKKVREQLKASKNLLKEREEEAIKAAKLAAKVQKAENKTNATILYKQLRKDGMSVVDAKLIAYPIDTEE